MQTLQGKPAGPGTGTGPAVHVEEAYATSYNGSRFPEGSVLVTGMTTPDFVPLFSKAAAIVTAKGGITCHAALVAREMGVPCVVGLGEDAIRSIAEGAVLTVHGSKGLVEIAPEDEDFN